ncbi:MAG: V-type ATPase subunit, partial [Acutalibacteraceae bacterium]
MKNTDFAYAVTSIRAKEAELLKPEFTEQLISAPDFSAAKRMLTDRGFKEFEKTDDASAALVGCMSDVWNFIKDVAPDIAQLYFLIVKNDFHNLKAVLKSAVFDGADPEEYYIYPCIYGPAELF